MSTYTTQVRYICEQAAGLRQSVGLQGVDDVIAKAIPSIFTDYPIFDESYRQVLNTKILRHFYMREIGFETVGLWKFHLANKLNEIMPYYNQLYKSEQLKFNPFTDTDYTRTHKGSGKQDTTEATSGTRSGEQTGTRSGSTTSKEDGSVTSNSTDTWEESGTNHSSTTKGTDDTTTLDSKVTGSSSQSTTGDTTDTSSMTTENTTNTSGESSTESATSSDRVNKFSDTPQGGLSNLLDGTYLTNATQESTNGSDTSSGKTSGKTTVMDTQRRTGGTTSSETVTGESGSTTESTNTRITNESSTVSGSSSSNSTDTSTGKSTSTSTGTDTTEESSTGTSTEQTSGTRTGNLTSTDEWLEQVSGKVNSVSYMDLLMKYRDTFLNIDRQIILELDDLFMGLW